MVIGGQFFNTSTRDHDMVPQVEVLGREKSCQVFILDIISTYDSQY